MIPEPITALISKASSDLRKAEDELYKPFEDVMCSGVCLHARNAIYNLMAGYLAFINKNQKGKNTAANKDMSYRDLLMECIKSDNDFGNLPVHPLQCSWSTAETKDVYCFSYYKVKECYDLAKTMQEYIMKRMNMNANAFSANGKK